MNWMFNIGTLDPHTRVSIENQSKATSLAKQLQQPTLTKRAPATSSSDNQITS